MNMNSLHQNILQLSRRIIRFLFNLMSVQICGTDNSAHFRVNFHDAKKYPLKHQMCISTSNSQKVVKIGISVVHSNALDTHIYTSHGHAKRFSIPKAIHMLIKWIIHNYKCTGIIYICMGGQQSDSIYRHRLELVWFNCRSGTVSGSDHIHIQTNHSATFTLDIVYRHGKTMLFLLLYKSTLRCYFLHRIGVCMCIVVARRICCRRQNDYDDIDFYSLIRIERWTVRTIRDCLFVCMHWT